MQTQMTGAGYARRHFGAKAAGILACALAAALAFGGLVGCGSQDSDTALNIQATDSDEVLAQIPSFTGSSYTVLNDKPNFTDEELSRDDFIELSSLDSLGRCGVAFGIITSDTMPDQDKESRGDIHEIHPSGWRQKKYDSLKSDEDEDGHLYERSHLLGWALTGLNAEERNLITGTHYFNNTGMLQFEKQIARYVERHDGRVLYRVTPMYAGSNLVATGVRMEAYSLDDDGDSVCFDVFVYNVQPGIRIDYATGDSEEDEAPIDGDAVAVAEAEASSADDAETTSEQSSSASGDSEGSATYVLNTKSHKFHVASCPNIDSISADNREETSMSRDEIIAQGYEPSGDCNP